MLQVGGDLDLGQEPLRSDDRGQLQLQDLQSDIALVLQILRKAESYS